MDIDFSKLDLALLSKFGIGTALVVFIAGAWKYAIRRLEIKVLERKDDREAEAAAGAAALEGPAKVYGEIIERLNAEITRLRMDDEAVATTMATNLTFVRDLALKTGNEISKCHEERRADRIVFKKRLLRERRRSDALELRVADLEQRLNGV